MRGLLADANIQGQVEYLVQRMQAAAWNEFWQETSSRRPGTVEAAVLASRASTPEPSYPYPIE